MRRAPCDPCYPGSRHAYTRSSMRWRGGLRPSMAVAIACSCSVELTPRPRPPAPPSRTSHLGLEIGMRTLSSGLRVVTVRDPHATEVQVTMRYQVGASADGAHPGLAHLVEHLMFQQDLAGQPLFTHLEDSATYF